MDGIKTLKILDEEEVRIRLILIRLFKEKFDEYQLGEDSRIAFYFAMYCDECKQSGIDPFDFMLFMRNFHAETT